MNGIIESHKVVWWWGPLRAWLNDQHYLDMANDPDFSAWGTDWLSLIGRSVGPRPLQTIAAPTDPIGLWNAAVGVQNELNHGPKNNQILKNLKQISKKNNDQAGNHMDSLQHVGPSCSPAPPLPCHLSLFSVPAPAVFTTCGPMTVCHVTVMDSLTSGQVGEKKHRTLNRPPIGPILQRRSCLISPKRRSAFEFFCIPNLKCRKIVWLFRCISFGDPSIFYAIDPSVVFCPLIFISFEGRQWVSLFQVDTPVTPPTVGEKTTNECSTRVQNTKYAIEFGVKYSSRCRIPLTACYGFY